MPKRTSPVTEWIGGTISLPAYVNGEGGEPYRPEALLWMGPDGLVLGMTMMRPEEVLALAIDHFRETTQRPMVGRPHVPTRIRVASAPLADALRKRMMGGTEVVCAPTPELEPIASGLREHLNADPGDEPPTYLTPGVTPDAVSRLFRSAARLYRATPWKVIPDDASVVSVTIPSLDVRDAALSIIGKLGESLGWILFPSYQAFSMFLDAAMGMDGPGPESPLPPHFALNFERGAAMSREQRKEIAFHGWEVAGPDAYPWLAAVDADLVARPPTAREVTIAEVIGAGLALLVETEPTLPRAWERSKGIVKTLSISTATGPVDITLGAPYAASSPRVKRGGTTKRRG